MRAAEWICSVCVFPALVDLELFQGRGNVIQDRVGGQENIWDTVTFGCGVS